MVSQEIYIDKALYSALKSVPDPEIPVISIIDLGMVREARLDGHIAKVKITPTYTGCPATDLIAFDVGVALEQAGFIPEVQTVLSPPWTTDWITEEGRQALKDYGIAPPEEPTADRRALMGETNVVECPQCGSTHTKMVSQFGSTACKALFKCQDCEEPFDYFKCLI